MRLLNYRLQNWGPHKEQNLNFPEESKTIAICGENDKGKSWIVRGIGFTLSIGRNEYGDQSSIHCGEQNAYHELTFEHAKKTYKIEKYVNGKGSEEEGTVTKINGEIVNRAEYEEFYKSSLGLPHPSIWLPICISMQNQTDFHLRSKKRDREEALRAICQLNKIDNWKDSLNQVQKEEDRQLLSYNSKSKGTLEQIELELSGLEKKLLEQSVKLSELKSFIPNTNGSDKSLAWEEIISVSKSFEFAVKEVQRKRLEKANITRELNLIENSLTRSEKELEGFSKNLEEVQLIEAQRGLYKHCLRELRLVLLTKTLDENDTRKHHLNASIEDNRLKLEPNLTDLSTNGSPNPNPTPFRISEAEEILSVISQNSFIINDSIEKINQLKSKLKLNGDIDKNRIESQLKNKRSIKDLLLKALIEIKTLKAQEKLNYTDVNGLCQKLNLSVENILKEQNILQSKLVTEELDNLSQVIKNVLWSKLNSHSSSETPSVECPICQSTITKSNLNHKNREDNLGKLENSKLKLIFNLDEKVNSLKLIVSEISNWENEFESQTHLETEIKLLDANISGLEQLHQAIETLLTHSLEVASPEKDLITFAHSLLKINESKEKSTKSRIQAFNAKNQFQTELNNLIKENNRITQQIEFYREEEQDSNFNILNPSKIIEITSEVSEEELKNKIQVLDKELSKVREVRSAVENKKKEIIGLQTRKKACRSQSNEIDTYINQENKKLEEGHNMPLPKNFLMEQPPSNIADWQAISSEWLKREAECHKVEAIASSINPRLKELCKDRDDLIIKIKESEKSYKHIACAKKLISFLDYKNAPRKLLEGVVTNLFELTNKLGEALDVDIKLKLGKNLEFLTVQSRSGKWIEQKTERLGYGKGAILGICFRLACQKLLLPETGFLILDEPTANVDIKRKGLFKLFLQNLSEDYPHNTQSKTSQIILIEHDEDVVELCQTKVDIREHTL